MKASPAAKTANVSDMAYIITIADFKTHIYEETMDEISREDNSIVTDCIEAAISEAAGFMGIYDVDALLGTPTTNATVEDKNLKRKVLDIAKFYLVTLGNPNIDYESTVNTYEMTINNYFKLIQNGKLSPSKPKWPYLDTSTQEALPEGDRIEANSNTKRQHR